MIEMIETLPSRIFSNIAIAGLEEAFLLCIPETGDSIPVANAARRMGLRDSLFGEAGLELAHALAFRLEKSGRVKRWTDESGWICVTRRKGAS